MESPTKSLTVPPMEHFIEAWEKVHNMLLQKSIKGGQKEEAHQTIGWAIEYIKTSSKNTDPTEDSARLVNIENEITKIRKAITEPTQTYAQAVQKNTGNPASGARKQTTPGTQDRMEKLKWERAKTEVMLTTNDASDGLKAQLSNISEEELTQNLRQTIAASGIEPTKIWRAQKSPNEKIKIRCATAKEVEEVCSMDWPKAL